MSRLMSVWACSILVISSPSPMTRAESRTSWQAWSSRVMTRTIVPSATSVSSVICSKGCERKGRSWLQSSAERGRRERVATHHALGPLVDGLDEAKLERRRIVLVRDLVLVLDTAELLGDVEDDLLALGKLLRDDGLAVRLFVEDEAREQRDDLLGRKGRERILQNELGEDELVGRVDLCGRGS
jgi:hypothetical protein